MSEALFELEPAPDRWQGPFESAYGVHLVLLAERSEGGIPDFEEVRDVARTQAQRAAIQDRQEEAVAAIVDTYEIRRTLGGDSAGQP
jgi:parvulin-like peptidyl-prolyl isomerase